MANCLVTRLKAVVDDDSLKKLGEIRFTAKGVTTGDYGYVRVTGNSGGHAVVHGGTAYADLSLIHI